MSQGALLEALEDILEAVLRAVEKGNVEKEIQAVNGQFVSWLIFCFNAVT